MTLCQSGHEMPNGKAFCTQCGSPTAQDETALTTDPANHATEAPYIPRTKSFWSVRNKVIIGIVIVSLLAATGAGIRLAEKRSSPQRTVSNLTPLKSCSLNMSNWIIYNHNTRQETTELTTFGTDSAITTWLSGIENDDFALAVDKYGEGTAEKSLATAATKECAGLAGEDVSLRQIPGPPASANAPAPVFNGSAPIPTTTPPTSAPASTPTTSATDSAPSQIGPPPGQGLPWQVAPQPLVTEIVNQAASNPNGSYIFPSPSSFWTSQDPNNPQWYFVYAYVPLPPGALSDPSGAGIEEYAGGTWTIVSGIGNQAPGCFGPQNQSLPAGTSDVPSNVLSDFAQSC